MTISAKPIRRPRKVHGCAGVHRDCVGRIRGPHVRAYGRADDADPPFVIRLCLTCASVSPDSKITAAVDELDIASWPYGPPHYHEPCCLLHEGADYCDCKASDASDTRWGLQAAPAGQRWEVPGE